MTNNATATYSGRSIITNKLKGNGTEPKFIGWGGANAAPTITGSTNSDVNLFLPASEARATGTSVQITTAQLADTYQVTGSITAAAIKTISEAGLFDSGTNSPTTTLAVSIASGTTSISLGAQTGPTALNYYAQIGNEVVLVTAGQTAAVVTVVRAQLGSTASGWPVGTSFTPGGDGGAYQYGPGLGGATASPWPATLPGGGSMFAHADFAGIAVSIGDSINFTFKDQFN
jgi:hypothetical protein